MLSPRAVNNFKNRKLDSWDFMKGLSRRELVKMIRNLDPVPEFVSADKMWRHQLAAFLIGVHAPHFLFFIDMGGGKTRVILELIAYRKLCGQAKAAIVITVDDTNIENWVMESEQHRPDLKVVPLYGSTSERRELLEKGADLYVAHYTAIYHMCAYIPRSKGSAGKKKGKMKISKSKLNKVADRLYFICLDECTKVLNSKSLTFRTCFQLGEQMRNRYGLAALPHGRDPTALWGQFKYCDQGETLGETLGLFRQAFFKKGQNRYTGFPEWNFDKRKSKDLNRVIKHRSITYDESEFRDVPKVTKKKIYVPFTEDMKAYYNSIVDEVKKGDSDLRMVRNSFMHMRQIASGFIGLIDDETGNRAQLEFPDNPKMNALKSKLQELENSGRKFLIYHQYNWTGGRIERELKDLGVNFLRLRGGQKKDNPGILRRFRSSKSLEGLVIQNQVGAYGLNLQVASVEFFVESPTSPIDRSQAEMRLRPALNKRHCLFFDIIMKNNSADENIQDYLQEGRDLQSVIMKGKSPFKEIKKI